MPLRRTQDAAAVILAGAGLTVWRGVDPVAAYWPYRPLLALLLVAPVVALAWVRVRQARERRLRRYTLGW